MLENGQTIGFECFLTGDGKGMQVSNYSPSSTLLQGAEGQGRSGSSQGCGLIVCELCAGLPKFCLNSQEGH